MTYMDYIELFILDWKKRGYLHALPYSVERFLLEAERKTGPTP